MKNKVYNISDFVEVGFCLNVTRIESNINITMQRSQPIFIGAV